MDSSRFDRLSRVFAQNRLSRRQTLTAGAAGIAASAAAIAGTNRVGAAQDATPEPESPASDAEHRPEYLFVQTYQSGTITPKEGVDGRYTLTLDAGSGQTIYFTDRPDRIVGANPTAQFLVELGFPDDNPPNAALVLETAPGETDVAVVELFSPVYNSDSQGVTYEIEVLANWQNELEMGFSEAPTDLASLAPSFGAAHLFIDGYYDCPNADMVCRPAGNPSLVAGTIPSGEHDGFCSGILSQTHTTAQHGCVPCQPWITQSGNTLLDGPTVREYWAEQCNQRFREGCNGNCYADPWCLADPWYGNGCASV